MTPLLTPTPTEELEMRQLCANVWSVSWANATDLTPEQSFTEGYLLAFWGGILAMRQVKLEARQRTQQLVAALPLLNLGMWAAVTWAMAP
jgi:hypothetical protein